MSKKFDVYWANALFSLADRNFNSECAKRLRNNNITVFLPQEGDFNKSKSPTEIEIFENDIHALNNSAVLVACIDQETIDCGVGCEIGLAYQQNMPIIGLYTDVRRDRLNYKMYKNPFVMGVIMKKGKILNDVEALSAVIKSLLDSSEC